MLAEPNPTFVKITSGSTGVPKIVHTTLYYPIFNDSPVLYLSSKRSSAFALSTHALFGHQGEKSILPLTAHELSQYSADEITSLVQSVQPQLVIGSLPLFVQCLRSLQAGTRDSYVPPFRHAYLFGESPSRAQIVLLHTLAPQTQCTIEYGLTELSGSGQHMLCPQAFAHPDQYSAWPYHAVDPSLATACVDTVDKNGWGYITFLTEYERHVTNDIGRIVHETCSCGAPYSLYVGGRGGGNNVVTAAGAVIRETDIRTQLSNTACFELLDDYLVEIGDQVHDTDLSVVGTATCYYVRNSDTPPSAVIASECETALRAVPATPTRTIGDLIDQGLFDSIQMSPQKTIRRHSPAETLLRRAM